MKFPLVILFVFWYTGVMQASDQNNSPVDLLPESCERLLSQLRLFWTCAKINRWIDDTHIGTIHPDLQTEPINPLLVAYMDQRCLKSRANNNISRDEL